MKKILLGVVLLPAFLFAQSQRQTTYPSIPDCYVQGFSPHPGGGNLLSGYSRYASDSSLISMIFLNDSDEIVSHKEFNTATRFDFASHVLPVSNGFLIGGKSSDTSFFHPQLIRTDASGNVQWAKYFDNLSSWQGQVIRIIPNGATYSLYTYAETPTNDFYRIETDAGGNNMTGKKYVPDTPLWFRIFDAEAMTGSSSHILCGHANFNSASTRGGLLMKATSAGIDWCKQITAGGNFKNDIVDVIPATGGISYSVFVCENMPGNQYSTIVLKFDSLGNKIWATQLSLPGGTLNGCSIIETASGDLVVATYDNLYVSFLTKLDASGNLLWTRQWTPSLTDGAQALKLFKDAAGNIVFTGMLDNNYFVARLDAGAEGCDFANSNAIAVTTVNPVLTNISFTTVIFAPTTVNESVVYSSMSYAENVLCGGVGIDEEDEVNPLLVYPNPTGNKLAIGIPLSIGMQLAGNSIIIRNVVGEIVLDLPLPTANCPLPTELDVSILNPGLYILQASDGNKIYKGKFIKQ